MKQISSVFKNEADKNESSGAGKLGQRLLAELSKSNPDTSVAVRLMKKGADVNARDESGNTPLILAASWALIDIAAALVGYGASLNAQNALGQTAADVAYGNGYIDMLELLDEKRILNENIRNGMPAPKGLRVFPAPLRITKS